MAKKPKIGKTFTIRDLETLKVLSDPLRMDILRFVSIANQKGRFATVKEIADELEMPNTKLYYHINLLEKHGLLVVGDTQIVSGIIEKQYQIVAEDISVGKHILSTDEDAGDEQLDEVLETISSLLDKAHSDFKKSLKTILGEKRAEKEGGPPARKEIKMHLQSNEMFLTEAQAAEMKQRLNALMENYDKLSTKNLQKDAQATFFGFQVLLTPLYHRTPNPNADQPTSGETQHD
jgi:hypothetical protein